MLKSCNGLVWPYLVHCLITLLTWPNLSFSSLVTLFQLHCRCTCNKVFALDVTSSATVILQIFKLLTPSFPVFVQVSLSQGGLTWPPYLKLPLSLTPIILLHFSIAQNYLSSSLYCIIFLIIRYIVHCLLSSRKIRNILPVFIHWYVPKSLEGYYHMNICWITEKYITLYIYICTCVFSHSYM